MREITLKKLRQNEACNDRYTKLLIYLDSRGPKYWPDDRRIPVSYIFQSNGMRDALWAVTMVGAGRVEVERLLNRIENYLNTKVSNRDSLICLGSMSWSSRIWRRYFNLVVYHMIRNVIEKEEGFDMKILEKMLLYAVGE